MARRKARQSRKVPPAELTMSIPLLGDGTTQNLYLDIAQNLSLLNRKFFRSGYEYVVENVELVSNAATSVSVHRISKSWPVANAWVKAMALWKKQQDETMSEMGARDTIAKYRDFKVTMDPAHAVSTADNLLSSNIISFAAAQVISPTVAYEWEYSEVVVPNDAAPGNTTEMPLHWVGPDIPGANTSKSVVKAYAQSRQRPQQTDPNIVNVALGGLFGEMFDVGDDSGDIVNNAQEENNVAPYYNDITPSAHEFYPGGEGSDGGSLGGMGKTQEYFLSTAATGRFISSYGGSCSVPGGLLQIVHDIADGDVAILKIKIAPGHYKGAMARKLQDVN